MSNGEYQLRIICWLCLKMGKRALKWDEVEQDQVIRIFANHFLREAEQRQAERDLVDGILAVTKWV
jgi:hypothetical protein